LLRHEFSEAFTLQPELLKLRSAGVVLHPTSLPGPHGSGDFGPDAYYFVDWLHSAGQTLWQTLPLGPIGLANSPYMGRSAMAGNPFLVAFEPMVAQGWLSADALRNSFVAEHVRFEDVLPWRMERLREAFAGFQAQADAPTLDAFALWQRENSVWLDDYALFMALDTTHATDSWTEWPAPLAQRAPKALTEARVVHAQEIAFWAFLQWQFDLQLQALKTYANGKGVYLVGDLPIFIAHHSCDCWARPDLYLLDADGQPTVVAGVPPDYFAVEGQRWGNPLYDWKAMAKDGYRWWVERIRRQLRMADVIRIDHFRGFEANWEIAATEPTAINGRWVAGPGYALFEALERALGQLPIIAEDLGLITPEVEALRLRTGFPGMRVLQFAFSEDAGSAHLPHNYERNTVVYCGTHDNDMAVGWWVCSSVHERAFAAEYLGTDGHDVNWAMIRACAFSVANHALCQLQDVLGLDGYHRMNTPGSMQCWTWRFRWDWVGPEHAARLARITAASGRAGFEHLPL
jgi:4-alpha-glucanotransferase